jgi:hypothetical protein
MEEVASVIKSKRPKLSDSSIKSYISILKSLYVKIDKENHLKEFDPKFFVVHKDKVMKYLMEFPPASRKTKTSAIIVLLKSYDVKGSDIKDYVMLMTKDIKECEEKSLEQKKTEKEKDNWITYDELMALYRKKMNEIKTLWTDKDSYDKIQDAVILAVVVHNPRRIMDWIEMKISGSINKDDDNYILNLNSRTKPAQWCFNKYKTAKVYHEQCIDINKEILPLIKKWIKYNDHDYLFTNDGEQFNQVQFTRRLNSIFGGKNISVNIIRHAVNTHFYADTPALKKMAEHAEEMGHSIETALKYVRRE